MPAEHAVFLVRDGEIGVDPKETERRNLRHQRGQGRTADAHLGQTELAINQRPVEEDVDNGHDDGRESDDLRVADADVERAKQEVEHHEHDTKLPKPQILPCRRIDVFRLDNDVQQPMAKEEQNRKQQNAQAQHKQRSMLKYHADFLQVALAETPRDKNLDANGKAHGQGSKNIVIQTRHHGGAQLDGTEMAKKSGIGKGDDGLRQITQHNRVGDAPNLAVGDARFNHAAKIKISWKTFRIKICHRQPPMSFQRGQVRWMESMGGGK